MERKRKELVEFCNDHSCDECPLGFEGRKCGNGYSFGLGVSSPGYIPDADVKEMYKIAFPERIDSKSIKMLTDWCVNCTNRKTCAIDEGFREECNYNGTSIPTLWEMDNTVKREEKPSPREEILREAIKCVCTGRNQQYGEPEDSFRMIGDLWGRYIAEKCLDVCTDENGEACCHVEILPEDVALLMVLFKVCRGATGEKITKDTLVDIAGYAACAGGMIE